MTDILEKLGLRKKQKEYTTQELKRILELKPGEKTPTGNIVSEEYAEIAAKIPVSREERMKKYLKVAYKECIEDIRYNTPIVSTECICKKIRDEKFRDTIKHPERHIPESALTKMPKKL